MPFFSVLIPSYNRPEFVGAAVESVLHNGYGDFEIIVSDDKSPRQSEIKAVLDPYLRDPRVRLHLQTVNLREAANREFLLGVARGDWHIILCDDDKLLPRALGVLADAIRTQAGADLYAFGYAVIDEHDRVAYARRAPKPLRIAAVNLRLAQELLVSDAFPFWFYHPATFCSHRSVRERVKPNPDVGIGDDIMFLIDYINSGGQLHVVPEVLMQYRKMSRASTVLQLNQSTGELPNLISRARILQHLLQRSDLLPALAEFVATPTFRERLLYDPVVWAGLLLEQVLPHLALRPDEARELAAYVSGRSRRFHRLRLIWRRVAFFCGIFGLAGLKEIVGVQLRRMASRTH